MKKKRIIISVTSDLSTDHRIQKVSSSLFKAGYDILLIGRKTKKSIPFQAEYSFKQFHLLFNSSFLFYAEYNLRLFFVLLFSKADILLSNDLDTLLANFLASKIRRKKIVYDSHELFTEVPELNGRFTVKKIWECIERLCLPNIKNCYTVCQSIADFYNKKYKTNMQVVRNVPSLQKQNKQLNSKPHSKLSFNGKKIILYQGALNIGRGIEWIIDAMPMIENAVLVIIGDGDISKELKIQVQKFHLEEKVVFLGRITCEELPAYTIAADLGLCLLHNNSLSYYYSLPNRIFDYMYAHVPVLATDFPEIANIVNTYHTGILINHYEPEYLAQEANKILTQPIDMDIFDNAIKNFCWENEEKILLNIFNEL